MSALKIVFIDIELAWQLALCTAVVLEVVLKSGRGGPRAEKIFRALARIHQELWIAVPPGIVLNSIALIHGASWWQVFFQAVTLFNWIIYRDWPDENVWKKRGRKLRDRVSVRAGRLVVVSR